MKRALHRSNFFVKITSKNNCSIFWLISEMHSLLNHTYVHEAWHLNEENNRQDYHNIYLCLKEVNECWDENHNEEQNIFDNHIKSLIKILISNYEINKLNKEILKEQPYKTQEDLLIK